MAYEIGSTVFGSWEIVREIGYGAYGHVYEIRKTEFGVTATSALKLIRIPTSEKEVKEALSDGMDPESVSAYFRGFVDDLIAEISVMAKFSGHPNIVGYQDHHVEEHKEGIGWDILIRMELLESLINYQLRKKKFSEKQIIRLGRDIANALVTCEELGIVHRDVKPDNIFVDPTGNFKLGDFGVARAIEKTTGGLSKKGTESYMAPEVYFGKPYGKTVDIYSLGIVLYRMTNQNRMPFYPLDTKMVAYADREEALSKRMKGTPIPAPCDASSELAEIILKACAYDPKERWQSARDLKAALEDLMGHGNQDNGYQDGQIEETVGIYQNQTDATVGIREDQSEEIFGVRENQEDKTIGVYEEPSKKTIGIHEEQDYNFAPEIDSKKKKNTLIAILAAIAVVAGIVIYVLIPKAKEVFVSGGSGSGEYKKGQKVSIKADGNEGYDFTGWIVKEGDVVLADSQAEETTFLMGNETVEVEATYELKTYPLTVKEGSIQGTNGDKTGKYQKGERITVEPKEKEGYTFTGWKSSDSNVITQETGNNLVFEMPAEEFTVTAEYEETTYSLSIQDGTVKGGDSIGNYTESAEIMITAEEKDGYDFVRWEVTQGNILIEDEASSETTVTIGTEDAAIAAVYEEKSYLLTVENGTIEGENSGLGRFNEGELITVVPEEKDHCVLTGWRTSDSGIVTQELDDRLVFEMPAKDIIVTAELEEKFSITVENGILNGEGNAGNFSEGTEVTIQAEEKEGYRFNGWEIEQGDLRINDSTSADTTAVVGKEDSIVQGLYEERTYQLTVEDAIIQGVEGGTSGIFHEGEKITLIPDEKVDFAVSGWRLSDDSIAVQDSGDSLSFYMPAEDLDVAAEYEEITYSVIVEGGTINGSGNTGEYTKGSELQILADERNDAVFLKWEVEEGQIDIENDRSNETTAVTSSENAKVKAVYSEKKSLNDAVAGDVVSFGSYEQDEKTDNGNEAIDWLVLDRQGDQIFVVSRYALDRQRRNNESWVDITWGSSYLRDWLNNTFYYVAFTEEEQSHIVETIVQNDENGGGDTQDKVFLLSAEEVEKYFPTESDRQCKTTDYVRDDDEKNDIAYWWLRSQGPSTKSQGAVFRDKIRYYGDGLSYDNLDVRPAIWINTSF